MVRRVTTREFRAGLREIIQSGDPVIVTKGRGVSGVFFPAKFHSWHWDSQAKHATERIRRALPEVLRDLEGR